MAACVLDEGERRVRRVYHGWVDPWARMGHGVCRRPRTPRTLAWRSHADDQAMKETGPALGWPERALRTFVRSCTPRACAKIGALAFAVIASSAHVGSPDVWMEGKAGAYPVVVNVQVPGVVPGIAQVYVRVAGSGVREVAVSGNRFDAMGGAPPPEVAKPVDGDAGLYHVALWFMTPGSNSVNVYVHGARGDGRLMIPTVIVAHQRLKFGGALAAVLAVVGIALFLGMISIVGAVIREGSLAPGQVPSQRQGRRARLVMGVATLVIAVVLLGGWRWWNAEDAKFARTLYQPMSAEASIRTVGETQQLDFMITDSNWRFSRNARPFNVGVRSLSAWRAASSLVPLVPDHGKIMHLFLVRERDNGVIAHLHPTTVDSLTFTTTLPPVPAGRYRVFADVVRESGEGETMTAHVDVLGGASGATFKATDSDDSWHIGPAVETNSVVLEDGSTMRWEQNGIPLVTGRPAPLTFVVMDNNRPVVLEPYMGMAPMP